VKMHARCRTTGIDWIRENDFAGRERCAISSTRRQLPADALGTGGPEASLVQAPEDLRGKRIATELVNYTKRYFSERNIPSRRVLMGRGLTIARRAHRQPLLRLRPMRTRRRRGCSSQRSSVCIVHQLRGDTFATQVFGRLYRARLPGDQQYPNASAGSWPSSRRDRTRSDPANRSRGSSRYQ